MSDTPRTDVHAAESGEHRRYADEVVPADFARTLERENAALIAERDSERQLVRHLTGALEVLLNRYVGIVSSGDCGNWNPEEEYEVVVARGVLALVEARSAARKAT
jgi:hypothetical protein